MRFRARLKRDRRVLILREDVPQIGLIEPHQVTRRRRNVRGDHRRAIQHGVQLEVHSLGEHADKHDRQLVLVRTSRARGGALAPKHLYFALHDEEHLVGHITCESRGR